MGRPLALGMVVLVLTGSVAGLAAIQPLAAAGPAMRERPQTDAEPMTEPGAQLIGVVGAHQSDHEGAVAEASLRVRLQGAETADERAAIIESIYKDLDARLDELATRRETLETALDNDSITLSTYRARSASLTVRLRSIETRGRILEEAATTLSVSVLGTIDVDLSELEALQSRADQLQGDALVFIAPSFRLAAGGDTSSTSTTLQTTAKTTTDLTNGSETATNVSRVMANATDTVDRARERVADAEETLAGLLVSEETEALLEQAKYNLSVAEDRLAAAREAFEAGEDERAIELAREAIVYAERAIELADAAISEATSG